MIKLTWQGHPVGINERLTPLPYYDKRTGKWKARQILSKKYKDFKKDMVRQFYYQTCDLMKFGKSKVCVTLHVPESFDADALMKPIYDSIEDAGIVDNDSQVYIGHQHKDIQTKRGEVTRIEIEIEEIKE